MIFFSSSDAEKNTSPPTGELGDSGWDYEGFWGSFTGTPVGPHHFLTANHAGGTVGEVFSWNSVGYVTVARTRHPQADLALWQVATPFPDWAPVYSANDEVGKGLVVFGRGLCRGSEIHVSGASPTSLRGWRWGSRDGRLRWGENVVEGVLPAQPGFTTETLYARFTRSGGENEAHLATYDSGGGVFIQEGGQWELAGISLGVDGYFSLTGAADTWFSAAIFDAGGLFMGSNAGAYFVPDTANDSPSRFYLARISAYAAWIRSIAPVPPPALVSVVSRKAHRAGGNFDLNLPLTDKPGIEGRFGTTLKLLFTFNREIASVESVLVAGIATVAPSSVIEGPTVTLDLKSVAPVQWLEVTLVGVEGKHGGTADQVGLRLGVLPGDCNRDAIVSFTDVYYVQSRNGQITSPSNFRADLNTDGIISYTDVYATQSKNGTLLPSVP